eukprot:6492770-Lingulodinium_polyedra.AAC.1
MWLRSAAGAARTFQGRCDTRSLSHMDSKAPGLASGTSAAAPKAKRAASLRQASAAAAAQLSQSPRG